MKKIIALALALIMALSMGVVALAAETPATDAFVCTAGGAKVVNANYATTAYPGEIYEAPTTGSGITYANYKITKVDFTTGDLCGASMIESVKYNKAQTSLRVTLKESYTLSADDDKDVKGEITLTNKTDKTDVWTIKVTMAVNNEVAPVSGEKKAADAYQLLAGEYGKNTVTVMDEDGGYVKFVDGELTGTVKMNKDEKAYLNVTDADADTKDAIEAYLGEDYEAIVEYYQFETRAFKNEVSFRYDAYEDDPHFFYVWDGEKLVDLGAKYDDDEDVDDYVFTANAEGTIVVTDKEVVLAAEEATKNPDTGANDVVGVAAALAVVSLVAAGAVSLKK